MFRVFRHKDEVIGAAVDLVEHVSDHLASLGFTNQRDLDLIREDVRFTLPPELTTIAPASK